MTLTEIANLLVSVASGTTTVPSAARALGVAEDRLAVYASGARRIRERAIAGMFPHLHSVLDEDRWNMLVEEYFRAHPLRSFELGPDFNPFPTFVAARDGFPTWASDLADFEFHEWLAPRRPRSPDDDTPDAGPLRVSSTMLLRDYRFDLVRWIDDRARQGEPEARPATCVFWQDRNAESLRNVVEPVERAALMNPARAPKPVLDALRAADLILGNL